MRHELKTVEPFFQHVWDGDKKFELRRNDRGFQKGDELLLIETGAYPGRCDQDRKILAEITYVLSGLWLADGCVALGIEVKRRMQPWEPTDVIECQHIFKTGTGRCDKCGYQLTDRDR